MVSLGLTETLTKPSEDILTQLSCGENRPELLSFLILIAGLVAVPPEAKIAFPLLSYVNVIVHLYRRQFFNLSSIKSWTDFLFVKRDIP